MKESNFSQNCLHQGRAVVAVEVVEGYQQLTNLSLPVATIIDCVEQQIRSNFDF